MEDEEASGARVGVAEGEAVRSRWTPKPEQIVILESIFNSGMVNPPKDETVRIRKLLEKFGPVGDANVFYWFQNRRSRSRRRQRQIQATLNPIPTLGPASSSSVADAFLSHHNSLFAPQDLHYQSGLITVFINGVATEVGRGPVDIKAMFGGDYVLFHSSGLAVEPNHHGFLLQTSLQHGESYFLVPRHS